MDSLLPERNTEVCVGRGTRTTRPDLPGGRLGRGTIHSPFDATVDRHDIGGVCIGLFCFLLLDFSSKYFFALLKLWLINLVVLEL